MSDRTFWRAINALAHPIAIIAIILLVLNDHLLKAQYTSWWTGKLSDVAGLIFAPLLLAALLALVTPHQWPRREAWIIGVALVSTGSIFALANTLPRAQAITNQTWDTLLGGQIVRWRDPTDLLALPALGAAWMLWRQASDRPPRVCVPRWAVVVGAGLAIMATSVLETDAGPVCFVRDGDSIFLGAARSTAEYLETYPKYFSIDGGLSWEDVPYTMSRDFDDEFWQKWRTSCRDHESSNTWQLEHQSALYRFERSRKIEVSHDDGDTWDTAYDLHWISSRARAQGLKRTNPSSSPSKPGGYLRSGPYDAISIEQTGLLIVAMGPDGLLVLNLDASWEWVAIDDHQFTGVLELEISVLDLWPALAIVVTAMLVSMATYLTAKSRYLITWITLLPLWFVWIASLFQSITVYPYATSTSPLQIHNGVAIAGLFAAPIIVTHLATAYFRQHDLRGLKRALLSVVLLTVMVVTGVFVGWQQFPHSFSFPAGWPIPALQCLIVAGVWVITEYQQHEESIQSENGEA